ncbi:chromatin assembly factor 1 subunit A-like [Ostrea edulis]|uniref:chromatin assembly factor 1 subunit A-like n=1 Tax=Ostrea edulis TaxID=37623 RepID=UPI0020946DFF|nr:chromatin assembly factor 1 subunit A-like [Ostrea edulis]XP_048763818.1 chromatin assembly factor 1 subunit A-like [Ostrea edulis]
MSYFQSENDEELSKAYHESFKTRSCLPLLKEELKCKIQYRRLSRGEGEMKVEFEKQKEYKMTSEEVQKRNKRLMQNRLSAWKRRVNDKKYEEELLERIRRLEKENSKKEEEKRNLAHQKDLLCFLMSNHNCRLKLGLRPSCTKFVSLLKKPSAQGVLIT